MLSLETDCPCAADHRFDRCSGTYNIRALHEIILTDVARLGASAAHPNLTAVGDKVSHQFAEWGKPFGLKTAGTALDGDPHTIKRKKKCRFLTTCQSCIADDKRQ